MIYCAKCTKMLEDDVQFCPICNEEDPFWVKGQNSQQATETKTINEAPVLGAFRGEAFDKLREINRHIEENPQAPPNPDNKRNYEENDAPGFGLYIALLGLSVCLSFVGLLVGISFANKRNKHYRALGIVTITISAVFLAISLMFGITLVFIT